MNYFYLGLVIAGAAAVVWGLPAAHRLRSPYDVLAALAVLAGVILALLGVLLTAVPEFFNG
ncbi:hypothetical protein [Geobacter sp. DSM 9736]|uniref:hypothetical protein n=1 Tax=Geobacter sp. DSM 9736 TaxID=1277350 RepID=UPI000B500057|nr:hypothetical protein [Geobacter sp. DSM 9736]SNB47300.1 hypothetical protein SAMN06269301_2778 [Geobacter sp. DSM 9736]